VRSPVLTGDAAAAPLAALLPAAASTAATFGDLPGAPLFPEEAAAVAAAVESRRREYATVRACARRALAGLGHPPVPLVPGERGAPHWPAGVTGSMTHCGTGPTAFRACAVARTRDVAALGIDAEAPAPLPPGILEAVALPAERAALRRLAATAPGVPWDRLLFSAKESVYKAWFPHARRMLEFEEAHLELRTDGTLTARLLVPGLRVGGRAVGELEGRWHAGQDVLLTAVVLPAP
jgi:4'-phosphopantetheinyl transferase EntD